MYKVRYISKFTLEGTLKQGDSICRHLKLKSFQDLQAGHRPRPT